MDVSTVLETFSLATFSGHIGDHFKVRIDGADDVIVTLVRAEPLGSEAGPRAGGRTPFSLEFAGPAMPVYPQATYHFHHATIGDFEMFIVPIGPADGQMRYEAIFT